MLYRSAHRVNGRGEFIMKTSQKSLLVVLNRWKFNGWMVYGAVLVSFAAGSLLTARLMRPNQVRAGSNRVFELMVYHTVPGKAAALEAIFRDVSKLQDKHGLTVVGYWVPNEDPAWADTFIYVVSHPNREEAEKNWHALHADPAFPEYRKQASEIIEKAGGQYRVDEVYMRPTDFSAMK
jgi:NIPSNAP